MVSRPTFDVRSSLERAALHLCCVAPDDMLLCCVARACASDAMVVCLCVLSCRWWQRGYQRRAHGTKSRKCSCGETTASVGVSSRRRRCSGLSSSHRPRSVSP